MRAILCPDKVTTDEWLEVHATAHGVGLRSNITIMFGAVEGLDRGRRHLLAPETCRSETGGFTEFVPLPFVHMATPIFLQRQRPARADVPRDAADARGRRASPTGTLIDNIQVSWVKMGVEGIRQILSAGANDIGGTLMDENISRAAGAAHGEAM